MHAKSVSYTAEFKSNQLAQTLFPLFSPEGEKGWVPGWDYINLMGDTDLHEDDVFLTQTHDHAANEAIWIVKKYDPEVYSVQYYRIEPGDKVGIVKIKCDPLDHTTTRVEITYTYIGLSDSGNRFIEHFSQKDYDEFIKEWKYLLDVHFKKRTASR